MPLDALCLSAVAAELRGFLTGSRVDKIQQPEKDVLLLSMRGPTGAGKLLISAGGGSARVHLTAQSRENPAEPPMFCMLLRKHLVGARLMELTQPVGERLYLLRFACLDELGEASEKTLAVEMMGRSANLILIDGQGRILDCLRKVDAEQSAKRQLLPGLFYALPPRPDKPDLLSCPEAALAALLAGADRDQPGDRWLVSAFSGVSPLLARELIFRAAGETEARLAGVDPARLWAALADIKAGAFTPTLLLEGDKPFDLYCQPVRQYGTLLRQEPYPDFSSLLDAFFTKKEQMERQSQRSQSLVKLVKTRRDRAARKLTLRNQEQAATGQREQWRQFGDLIKANLYRMERGASSLTAENFYAEDGGLITVPLEPRLSPQQNAARYYKLYTKAKNAEKVLAAQIAEAQAELSYLDSVLSELALAAGERDLAEIRQELSDQGYLREATARKRKLGAPQPLQYLSGNGTVLLVGRNNLQNDWLTLKASDKSWLWFHAQKTHGAHVLARCGEEDREAVAAAALLAAWYSRGRDSSNVAVDYTRVKNVKKPAGAKPGMVIYTDYKTLFVTPTQAAVDALKRK